MFADSVNQSRFYCGFTKIAFLRNDLWLVIEYDFKKWIDKIILDGNSERISRTQFHIEDEIFNMDSIYDELISSIKSCRPDDEVANGMKQNSSIRWVIEISTLLL